MRNEESSLLTPQYYLSGILSVRNEESSLLTPQYYLSGILSVRNIFSFNSSILFIRYTVCA